MVKVSITKAESDFYRAFVGATNDIGGPFISEGDRVLIKPNLVEPAGPDSGQITTPEVIEAVGRYCLDYGASQVIIGEGPSYYQPQSHLRGCFISTGVSQVADRLGIRWVLFDEHKYKTFKGVSKYTPDEFRVTKFAFTCDKFINLPVLKTHYLTTVTLSMKNLKGCLKREDKPLFHHRDLNRAIVELCKLVRPTLNVIDCTPASVVRQLGVGYSSEGWQSGGGLLVVSSDMVATDTLGCALMGIDPSAIRTITLGADAGLGESDLARIDIIGEELKRLKFKVKLPQEQLRRSFPLLEIAGSDTACSGCLIPLLSSLLLLAEQGTQLREPLRICLGKNPKVPENKAWLLVGDCAQVKDKSQSKWVTGCPPMKEEVLSQLRKYISNSLTWEVAC